MELIIGNLNYSSWSLRPWLLLRHFDIEFDVHKVSLNHDDLPGYLSQFSPAGKVPVLVDGDTKVWDSLAICEYINEKYLDGRGWPKDPVERAKARSVVCEMHADYSAMRREMPMNCRASRKVTLSADAKRDVGRVDRIWSEATGDWLFGDFSIADCFFAPVIFRFHTYPVYLSDAALKYGNRMMHHPAMQEWLNHAMAEEELLEMDDVEVGEHI